MESERAAYRIQDIETILRQLAAAEQAAKAAGSYAPRLVLIGGQAVNFWAERYRDIEPALQEGPFTSKDVDFQAESFEVDWVAKALHVEAVKPAQESATEQTGKILFPLSTGGTCELDFLRRSIPNLEKEVLETAVPVPLEDGSATFWVMHPLPCMLSRAYNVVRLGEKYNTEHGRAQLRASVVCLRHFVLEMAHTDAREARDICKKVYRYARGNDVARQVYRDLQVDPFDAVPHDRVLGDLFFEECYPRWRDDLRHRRDRYKPPSHAAIPPR